MKKQLLIISLLIIAPFFLKAQDVYLRTNALFDLGLVPNLGVEIGVSNKISVGLDIYAGFLDDSDKLKSSHRTKGVMPTAEVRYYLNEIFSGHHIGITGTYYNLTAVKLFFADEYVRDAKSFGAGLLYGYTLKLSDNLLLSLDIGAEYSKMKGYYMLYDKTNDEYVDPKTYPTGNPYGKKTKNKIIPRGGVTLSIKIGGSSRTCPRYDQW